MANEYLKPQTPLQDLNSENYFYPLTTIDQIILQDNSTRLNSLINKSDFIASRAIYYNGTKLLSSENIFLNNNQIGINRTSLDSNYKFGITGDSLFNGILYFANGTTYQINNSADAILKNITAYSTYTLNISSYVDGLAMRISTRAGTSAIGTNNYTNTSVEQADWAQIYYRTPALHKVYTTAGDTSSAITSSTYYQPYWWFRQWSLNTSNGARTAFREEYSLPATDNDRTTNASYKILTTKNLPDADSRFVTLGTVQTITANKTFNGQTYFNTHFHWKAGANFYCDGATANNQEWSVDLTSGSYTGCYWHVWSGKNSASILQCYNDNRHVVIPVHLGVGGNNDGGYSLSAGTALFNNVVKIKYNTPSLRIVDSQTAADTYAIIRFGNKNTEEGALIFLNGPSRTADGGANMMTIRNNVGNLRLDNNTYVTGQLEGQNHFRVYTKTAGNAYNENGSAIQIREVNLVGTSQSTWTYAPKLGFHWGGRAAMQLGMNSSQELCLYINNSTNVGTFRAGTFKSQSANGLRLIYGSGTTKAVLFRNDGTNFWILNCDTTDTDSWYQYPLHIDLRNGYVYGSRFYNAVWNDYAEFRKADIIEPGYVVKENGDGSMSKAEQRLQLGAKIISDTYGFAIGQNKENNTPIAVSGRVLVYTYQDRNKYQPGMSVCAAPGGTVDIMTREEIQKYPDAIIGIVSEIPNYETWKAGNYELIGVEATMKNNDITPIQVNGRIWVYVR